MQRPAYAHHLRVELRAHWADTVEAWLIAVGSSTSGISNDIRTAARRKLQSCICNRTAAGHKVRRRFCGGGPPPGIRDLVAGICLSVLQDEEEVRTVFDQSWIESWHGWEDMEADGSDSVAMNVAERLLRIAGANVPTKMTTNADRLRELAQQDLHLKIASSHGENNCLIDSLLLGLMMIGVSPRQYTVEERKELCARCRTDLHRRHKVPLRVYLDGHRDTPRILEFFLQKEWAIDISVRVFFYDCLPASELGEAGQELSHVDFTWGDRCIYERHVLHVYNHIAPTGQGYHFDALLQTQQQENAQSATGNRLPACSQEPTWRTLSAAKQEAFRARLLSWSYTVKTLEATLQEDWVETWSGWEKLTTADEKECDKLATEFCRVARNHARKEVSEAADASRHAATLSATQVKALLQSFLQARAAYLQVTLADAEDVLACGHNREALALKLHTLLQAGVTYADSGMHAARRLVGQWHAYYTSCTQSNGRRLGETPSAENAANVNTQAMSAGQHDGSNAGSRQETGAPGGEARKRPLAGATGTPPKRLRGKQPPPKQGRTCAKALEPSDTALEGDEYILREWRASHGNPDPRAKQDMALEALGKHFRQKPTLPEWMVADMQGAAFDLAEYTCAFHGCPFASEQIHDFERHLREQHSCVLEPVAAQSPARANLLEAYRAGLTWACQQNAPTAHIAIDRRCLRKYREAQRGDKVGAAICFFCARRFPYTNAMSHGDQIQWKQIAGKTHLCGLSLAETQSLLGFQTYWNTYVSQQSEGVQERIRTELQDWCADVTIDEQTVSIICCPEDKLCERRCPAGRICASCRAPVCLHCWERLRAKQVSSLTLANDMLVFYTPRLIYREEVTFMELVCASPCFTAMACFSLEKKLLGERAMDQDAFMNRNRLVARGNATTFPLAWEDLLQNLQAASTEAAAGQLRVPKVGAELAAVVNVIIKAGGPLSDGGDAAKVIHQARVRRKVVLQLIADAKERDHPAYRRVCMREALQRAEALPEDGVPAEIVAWLPHDSDLDDVQRQKAATPTRAMLTQEELHAEFAYMCKPNAVVGERTTCGAGDINAAHVAALRAAADQHQASSSETKTTAIYTGNRLLDQFEPWYFAFAFAFLFPYGSGMPDPPSWSDKPRYRRPPDAERVEFEAWMRCMARRCESQINRDWTFGFTAWNLFFRSALNLSRTLSPYNAPIFDETQQRFRPLQGEEIEAGAQQLLHALSGVYADVRGNPRPVNGDISKLAYVRHLRPAARKLLKNMRHTARGLPGTQEARRQMRFEIEAMRIRYGVPLFITVSPDEAHQWLFIRMSRTRCSDPVRAASVWQEWTSGDRGFPPLDDGISFPIHLETFRRALPAWQQRRTLLARDPLASVDGFHTLLRLLCQHIFGISMCDQCPDCDKTEHPCGDSFGSSATLSGGAFGRVDAIYVTIEAQKSTGSLHGHMQCFVQCLHQHTPLTEIFQLPQWRLEALREEYCKYQAHVAHAEYSGQEEAGIREGIAAAESTWPEHTQDAVMAALPAYQTRRAQTTKDLAEAEIWRQEYLECDVVALQYLKQHHYHPISAETGERVPLRGCQKKENMGVCKAEFPRDDWLCNVAKVLCPCQLQHHGFTQTGRKNRLGALHGPYGHPYLNPCHPALLASMRGGNNDVQVPYRLPYACPTCGLSLSTQGKQMIALAAQRAQDAQTGYCSDYCSKNQPMGFHEIKEFQKGHIALHATLKQADVDQIGKRHANRFLSDAYCKGLVRGQVECCNLRANHVDGSIVAAERLSTCGFTMFPGHVYLQLLEGLDGKTAGPNTAYVRTRKAPGSGAQHLREAVTGQAYSHRPSDSECWWLSPYEFTMHWELVPARIPHSRAEWEAATPEAWDVALTPAGAQKLLAGPLHAAAKLKPSTDYRLKVFPSGDRVYFAATAATATLRHNWYLQRRARPRCPHFANAPVPQRWADKADGNARLTCVYFRAWTLDMTRATVHVPHLSHLLGANDSWEDALREWLLRLTSAIFCQFIVFGRVPKQMRTVMTTASTNCWRCTQPM